LEPRQLIAYTLLTVLGLSALTWMLVARRRRAARRLRQRGIKLDQRR